MIRLISIIFFVSILLNAFSQDLYNLENSRKFANYLYDSGQFDLATNEYERVVFLDKQDSISILKLLRSYHFQGKYDLGLKRANSLLKDFSSINKVLAKEYVYLNFRTKNFKDSNKFIISNENLSDNEKNDYLLSSHLLAGDWIGAERNIAVSQMPFNSSFARKTELLNQRMLVPKKNPYLAMTLSMIVPGSGKIYTGQWQDGLISMLFVVTNSWQAYRGFSKNGIKSPSGWIFGSLGFGFYIGNIYGSYRSAKMFNQKENKKFQLHVEKLVYSTF